MKTILVSFGCAGLFAMGCGGGGNVTPDAGAPPVAVTNPDGGPSSFGCLGNNPDPVPTGNTVALDIVVRDFDQGTPVADATVELYYGNFVDAMYDEIAGPTDTTGVASFVAAPEGGLIAYRITGAPSARVSTEYDVLVPLGGGMIDGDSVSNAIYTLIPTVWGVRPDPAAGTVAGRFTDCTGDSVEHAIATIVDMTGMDAGGEDHYFVMEFPNRRQIETSADGLFGVVNVPPGNWHIRLTGRLVATDPPVVLGQRVVQVVADGISIIDLGPLAAPLP